MSISMRLPLAVLAGGLLLGGCTQKETTRATVTPSTTTSPARTSTSASHDKTPARTRTRASTTSTPQPASAATDEADNGRTGIAACDDYLSSYLACHRAARIYAPDQLQSRYAAMRTSLLRDAKDPDIRPQLGARCNSLANQLRQALHGKSCESAPAPATSSP